MAAAGGGTSADGPGPEREARIARRTLLAAGRYALPALVGTFLITRRADAQASCLPRCECNPGQNLCGPDCCLPVNDCPPWFCKPIQQCGPF